MKGRCTITIKYVIYFHLLVICFIVQVNTCVGQTTFDSLKQNSNLDSSFQPSKMPTIKTEFANIKISGIIQPAFYYDNNNVFNNDLFVTSEIPTTKITDIKFRRTHLSANQSRLGFGFTFPTAKIETSALLQGDFFSSPKDEHSYFRLRHAYIKFGEFTVGKTWTNFGDVNGAPNTLDLEGPNSMPASRIAQVRWDHKLKNNLNLVLAIEEPKSDYTPLEGAPNLEAALPEIVVKTSKRYSFGRWVNSIVYKPIIYTDKEYSFKKHLFGWGATSSFTYNLKDGSKLNPFKIKKRTISVFGIIGSGTQGSVNDFGGLGYEAFPTDSVTLKTLLYYGGYVSFSFVWNKRWSSTFVYSYLHLEKPRTTNNIFELSSYFAANGIYAINKFFTVGGEVLYGAKKNYDDTKGSAFRILGLLRLMF